MGAAARGAVRLLQAQQHTHAFVNALLAAGQCKEGKGGVGREWEGVWRELRACALLLLLLPPRSPRTSQSTRARTTQCPWP